MACIHDQAENDEVLAPIDANLNCDNNMCSSKDYRAAWIGWDGQTWDGDCDSTFTRWNSPDIGGDSQQPNGNGPASMYASDNAGKPAGSWNDGNADQQFQCICSGTGHFLCFTALALTLHH